MQYLWAIKRKPVTMTLTPGECQLLKGCLNKAFPMMVYEHTMDWEWCYCPRCHSILDREYVEYCDACGQTLSWHGSTKHAVRLAYDTRQSKEQNDG